MIYIKPAAGSFKLRLYYGKAVGPVNRCHLQNAQDKMWTRNTWLADSYYDNKLLTVMPPDCM